MHKTADILESAELADSSLETLLRENVIDGNCGAIADIMRNEQLTNREALDRLVLDSETCDLQFPVACSLAITDVIDRGLYDVESGQFIHPESGFFLTLAEALQCEIINPCSQVFDSRSGSSVPLTVALSTGIVDHVSGDVQTVDGPISFTDALIEKCLYKAPPISKSPLVPPLGSTLPVVLKRKLIDADNLEMIHPSTRQRIPLQEAIRHDLLMGIPYAVSPYCVELTQALQCKMLDVHNQTFIEQTGQVMAVSEALERGSLIIKPTAQIQLATLRETQTESSETVVTSTTLVTKVIQLVHGYTLIGPDRVKNERTGKIIGLEKAQRLGLIVGAETQPIPFEEAVQEGLINPPTGTFVWPGTSRRMSINDALREGMIQLSGFEKGVQLQPVDEAVTSETLIYDSVTNRTMTAEQATQIGVLDERTGEYHDPKTGHTMSFSKAAQLGLIAVLGLPVALGYAVKEAVSAVASGVQTSKGPFVWSRDAEEPTPVPKARRMSVQDALEAKCIEANASILVRGTGKRMSFDQAVEDGVISAKTVIMVNNADEAVLISQPEELVCPVDALDVIFAVNNGILDVSAGSFIDNVTKEPIGFDEAVVLGLLDGEEILVRDLRCNSLVSLKDALRTHLVDRETGNMVDPKTGTSVPFFEAVKLGWIQASQSALKSKLQEPLTFKSLVDDGLYDAEKGLVVLTQLNRSMHV